MTEETLMDIIESYVNECYRNYEKLTNREISMLSEIRFKIKEWFEEQMRELKQHEKDGWDEKNEGHYTRKWLKRKIPLEDE